MSQQNTALKIFAGNSNPPLAAEISQYLKVALGKATVDTFSDGESKVEIKENVRGADVFVLQSTSAPGNNNLMELLLMLDAFKRASAMRITAVMPTMDVPARTAKWCLGCRSARSWSPT
jgi:ribose-phosphate pyrophosphokinase